MVRTAIASAVTSYTGQRKGILLVEVVLEVSSRTYLIHTNQKTVEPYHPTPTPPQTLSGICAVLPHPYREIHAQADEYKQRKDLTREPCNHDINSVLALRRFLSRRRIG